MGDPDVMQEPKTKEQLTTTIRQVLDNAVANGVPVEGGLRIQGEFRTWDVHITTVQEE